MQEESAKFSLREPIFYSNAEYAVRGIKQEKAAPKQWLKMIEKNGGLKAGEVTMPDLEENNTMHAVDVTLAMRESVMQGQPKFSLRDVNDRFNEELATLTEENARERILNVGTPSPILLACGIEDRPIHLYGAKLLSKVRKNGYKIDDLKNLPLAISSPIAVFEGSKENSFAILTALRIGNYNVLAALSVGKGGHDVDFNIISSVYDKREDSVARWVNDRKMLWVDKKSPRLFQRFRSTCGGSKQSRAYIYHKGNTKF